MERGLNLIALIYTDYYLNLVFPKYFCFAVIRLYPLNPRHPRSIEVQLDVHGLLFLYAHSHTRQFSGRFPLEAAPLRGGIV